MITRTSWAGVECLTCMSLNYCQPGRVSMPFGCRDWVSIDGRERAPQTYELTDAQAKKLGADGPEEIPEEARKAFPELCRSLDVWIEAGRPDGDEPLTITPKEGD